MMPKRGRMRSRLRRCRMSSRLNGVRPDLTSSIAGWYSARHASAKASQSSWWPAGTRTVRASRAIEVRQSASVPNTSKNSASIAISDAAERSDGEARDRALVDLDAEPGRGRHRDQAVGDPGRRADDVLGEIEVREAHPPVDRRRRAGEMDRGGRRDARFGNLRRHVDGEAAPLAETRGLDGGTHAAELDQLERDPACARLRMRRDIAERVDALVGAERNGRAARERPERDKVMRAERLLEEAKSGVAGAVEIAAGGGRREAAIGIGADRDVGTERRAHRAGRRDVVLDRLGADLDLEEAKALGELARRLGRILVGRRIAEEPHGGDRPAQRAAEEIDRREVGGAAREVDERELDRRMGAGVAEERDAEPAHQGGARPGVLADE